MSGEGSDQDQKVPPESRPDALAPSTKGSLADEAVPLREAERQLEREQTERIQTVVSARRLQLPGVRWPEMSRRWLGVLAVGLGVGVIAAAGFSSADSDEAREAGATVARPIAQGSAGPTPAPLASAPDRRSLSAAARARRRAALRARNEAARRRAAKRRHAAKARAARERSAEPVRTQATAVAAPSPEEAASSPSAPEEVVVEPSPPPSRARTDEEVSQQQFGFER